MPSWKKVILSGSDAALNSLNVSNGVTITGSLSTSGSNTLLGNTTLSGSIIISGSNPPGFPTASVQIYGDTEQTGYIKLLPVTTNINQSISASYIYVSGSTSDLYFTQNGVGYNNTTRLRWLEGNLYTGLLHGGVITSQSSTVYQISSGSGIIVDLNASLSTDPYPTIQFLQWPNLSASIAPFTASYQQVFVGIDSTNNIYAQGTPFTNGQFNTIINIGNVLFQNGSTINGFKTQPSVAYGFEQSQNVFNRAFGPLKLSGYTLAPSASSTGSLIVGSGTAYAPGSNYTIDPNDPSYTIDSGTNVSKIYRYHQSGSTWVYDTNGGAGYATINPSQYSNNGTLTSVGAGNWSIQRVFYFPNSVTKAIVVYYGNAIYATENDALTNIAFESFVEAPNTAANAIYLGAIIISGNGVFTNASTFTIYPGGLFRQVGGSGGGGSTVTQTLSGLSDVNISGPTNYQALVYDTNQLKWINASFVSASISGNAATATTASFASTASYVLNAVSSSFATTASYVATASYTPTLQQVTSQGNTTTGSINVAGITNNGNLFLSGSNRLVYNNDNSNSLLFGFFDGSSIYGPYYQIFGNNYSNVTQRGSAEYVFDTRNGGESGFNVAEFNGSTWLRKFRVSQAGIEVTGSTISTGGFTGSLQGTASYADQALSSSYAVTASFAQNFNPLATASYALQALSASYASSASLADSSENVLIYVKNQSGYNITKGLVVRITGSNNSSDIPRIVTASYENDDNSANTLGIASQTINDGSEGYVITEGILTGINTTGYTSGQLIYLGANGTITGSAPIAPLHAVRLGEVVRQQSNNGSIYVRIDNGYELGELHNVVDNTTTSSYGDLLVKSGSVWVNSKQLTGSYGLTGSLTGTSFVGSFTGSVQGTSSFAVSASHAVFSDTASFLPSTTNLNITSISASTAVFTSASIGFLTTVSGSATIIGDAYVVVNSSQATRYAGLAVYESGSVPPTTASWNFDSQNNDWFYGYSSSNGTDYGVALFGPAYTIEGSPTYLTNNRIPKSSGSHHLNDSNISDDGSRVSSAVPVTITGSITASAGFLGDLTGTSSYATQALTASYVATASYTPNLQQVTTKGNTTQNNIIVSGSNDAPSNVLQISSDGFTVSGSLVGGSLNRKTHQVIYGAVNFSANSTTTIAQLPAPKVAGFTFDYIAYVSGVALQAGRAGVVKGILRNTETGVITKAFQLNETTTLDLTDQGNGTAGLQFTIIQDTNGTSNQLVAIADNTWPYFVNYTLTIYYNPNFS